MEQFGNKGKEELDDESQVLSPAYVAEEVEVPDSVALVVNQFILNRLLVDGKVEKFTADDPIICIDENKFIAKTSDDKVMYTADWHIIGEYRINSVDESTKEPTEIQYIWSFALHDTANAEASKKVNEALPDELNSFRAQMFKCGDSQILLYIQAYAQEILELEYGYSVYSHKK